MTNQTFEGSGAARGTGLSGFHKRATEAKIGVYDWILPSRRVLLLATDLESYNWRLLERTATSQLESLGFTFSTRTQLGTMINMRRGGGGGGARYRDGITMTDVTDSVSVEIFSRDSFNTAFIRGYELEAVVQARKKQRPFGLK